MKWNKLLALVALLAASTVETLNGSAAVKSDADPQQQLPTPTQAG